MKNNYIRYVPYLRNSIAYDHDFCGTCVKRWYLQGFFFQFFKIFIFWVVRVVKGQKKVQNDKKMCLLHSISVKPYIIWLSFMVNICKMIISWSVFLIFENFNFLGAEGGKRAKKVHNGKKLSVTLHISGTIHHMIMIFWCPCVKWWYLQQIFSFLKILIFEVLRGVKGQKMT